MTNFDFTPQLFKITTNTGSNICTWDLLTLDGETPRDTVYFLNKEDAPSSAQSDQIVEAIENEEWEIIIADEDIVKEYSIDTRIFETAGELYSEIIQKLNELLAQ